MKKNKIYGDDMKSRLTANAKDKLHQFILADGQYRGAILHGTKMIYEMAANHGTNILETMLLGYGYIGAALLTSNLKGMERLVLDIDGDGPANGLVVEANTFGEVKGHIKNQPVPIERPPESRNIMPWFGEGILSVTKYLEGANKNPFTGSVGLEAGSFSLNLANYSLRSEQTPSLYSISIHFDGEGNMKGAGGLLLQKMPGTEDAVTDEIQEIAEHLPMLGAEYEQDISPQTFVLSYFTKYSPQFLKERRIEFMCHCSKKRFKTFLGKISTEEKNAILDQDNFPLGLTCHNCATEYKVSKKEFLTITEQ